MPRLPLVALALALLAAAPAIGAEDDPAIARGREWWAFQPVVRPAVPGEAAGNPIDSFLQAARAEVGLEPSPEADRATLVRRVTLDLTGLPPTPEEVDAFLADEAPDAYERLVDRLLASPRFGERWARPWLDLARYADSGGFEFDNPRPGAWRYRDWVVRSINEDMPYDRFVGLQLAADEIAPDDPAQLAALAFLRNGPEVGNQQNESIRMDELDDLVAATSSAFLGLTVACARCHDHKFDPIPTEDYYRLLAVFAPGKFAGVTIASPAEKERYRAEVATFDAELERLRAPITAIERGARDRLEAEKRAALPDRLRQALASGEITALSQDEQDLLAERIKLTPVEIADSLTAVERAARDEWSARVAVAEAGRPEPLPEVPGVVESPGRPKPTFVLVRGSVDRKGQQVRPGPPRAVAGRLIDFDDRAEGPSTGRRAALARWIADPANPLTARVMVSRIWQGHFGAALIPTPSDVGVMGFEPVVPELLDWLAAEFVERGWGRKAIHRLIVTSATYRQSSRPRPEGLEADPDNSLLWRFPIRRLDAEMLRDGILFAAGTLDEARGGPGVYPAIDPSVVSTGNVPRWPLDAVDGPATWRRSLYVFQMRSVPVPLLEVFDLPDSTQSCPERSRTTLPTQGLTLLNNPFVIGQARRLAERVAREVGDDPGRRVDRAFRLVTGRPPTEATAQAARRFLEGPAGSPEDRLADLAHVLLNSNAFLYID